MSVWRLTVLRVAVVWTEIGGGVSRLRLKKRLAMVRRKAIELEKKGVIFRDRGSGGSVEYENACSDVGLYSYIYSMLWWCSI